MLDTRIDAVVIGAGVVGLACGRALAMRGLETLIVERHARIGEETSSRNSEVIHAGLYYPTDSAKARLCVAGRERLYAYCQSHHVAHRRCGKLIVATQVAHQEKLEALARQAHANGVTDVRMLSAREARAMEPALSCVAALHSPSTGIIDSHGLMLALQGDFETAGGALALCSDFLGGEVLADGIHIEVASGGETSTLHTRLLVNAGGLSACTLAGKLRGMRPSALPTPYLAKGNYFSFTGRSPFSQLVYPVPEPCGLGVHLTLDLAGQARFGPDVEWVDRVDYEVSPSRCDGFYAEIRKYWPELPAASLLPAYSGIRPKIAGPGAPNADFLIQGEDAHGIAGLVNLLGIESPGLTSSLAIADEVVRQLGA